MTIKITAAELRQETREANIRLMDKLRKAEDQLVDEVITNLPIVCHEAAQRSEYSAAVMQVPRIMERSRFFGPPLQGAALRVFQLCKAAKLCPVYVNNVIRVYW